MRQTIRVVSRHQAPLKKPTLARINLNVRAVDNGEHSIYGFFLLGKKRAQVRGSLQHICTPFSLNHSTGALYVPENTSFFYGTAEEFAANQFPESNVEMVSHVKEERQVSSRHLLTQHKDFNLGDFYAVSLRHLNLSDSQRTSFASLFPFLCTYLENLLPQITKQSTSKSNPIAAFVSFPRPLQYDAQNRGRFYRSLSDIGDTLQPFLSVPVHRVETPSDPLPAWFLQYPSAQPLKEGLQ